MFSPFFLAWADWISGSRGPGCGLSDNARPTGRPGESLNGTGPESRCQRMSERSMPNGVEQMELKFYDPSRTLMPDGGIMENWKEQEVANALTTSSGGGAKAPAIVTLCRPCHVEKSRADWKGVSRKEATQSTSFAEASRDRVRTSRSQENERDLPVNDQDCSSRPPESLTLFSDPEGGSSLRTFPDSFRPTVEGISESFSRRWPTSGFTTSPGECWTADTSECPKGEGGFSSLPDVLEAEVPARFFLSPKAAAGILRRARKRGRDLPPALNEALLALSETVPESEVGK